MAPSGWEVLARIEKLEVGWQRVVALFSVHTTGAYGTKRAKSVGCPHYTCQCCKPGNDGKVYWRGCRKQARKRGQPENPGCQPWGRSSPGYVVEGVSGSEKCSSSYVNSRPSYWSSLYRELRGGFWIGSHIHTRLSAELSGISVTRQGFWESMALATRKMRHGGGGTLTLNHSSLTSSCSSQGPAVLRHCAGRRAHSWTISIPCCWDVLIAQVLFYFKFKWFFFNQELLLTLWQHNKPIILMGNHHIALNTNMFSILLISVIFSSYLQLSPMLTTHTHPLFSLVIVKLPRPPPSSFHYFNTFLSACSIHSNIVGIEDDWKTQYTEHAPGSFSTDRVKITTWTRGIDRRAGSACSEEIRTHLKET